MPYLTPPYMNLLSLEDLAALNELGTLTWGWEIKYWTEIGLSHGSFILIACVPTTKTWVKVDGISVLEAVNNFKKIIGGETL
jgi:hypothetical protein